MCLLSGRESNVSSHVHIYIRMHVHMHMHTHMHVWQGVNLAGGEVPYRVSLSRPSSALPTAAATATATKSAYPANPTAANATAGPTVATAAVGAVSVKLSIYPADHLATLCRESSTALICWDGSPAISQSGRDLLAGQVRARVRARLSARIRLGLGL